MAKPNITTVEGFTSTLNNRLTNLIEDIKQLDAMASEHSKPLADRVAQVIADQVEKMRAAWKNGTPNKYPKPTVAY